MTTDKATDLVLTAVMLVLWLTPMAILLRLAWKATTKTRALDQAKKLPKVKGSPYWRPHPHELTGKPLAKRQSKAGRMTGEVQGTHINHKLPPDWGQLQQPKRRK